MTNKNGKVYFLTLLLAPFWFVQNIQAQTPTTSPQATYNLHSMIATSPEAAMLGRYGDIPVGYYTGTADISIPLYTIKEDGLEIPITLSYHSSGVKVADQASNVGLGWLLEPGGAIIQIVNGAPDQSDTYPSIDPTDYTFLNSNVNLLYDVASRGDIGYGTTLCTTQPNSGDTQNSMNLLQLGDLQPDIYQYSFPGGYSGKFYLNPVTHAPVMIDKQKQIFFRPGSSTNTWIAETLDGDKYYFNVAESASDGSTHQGTTLKLSQIVMHNGKTISFSYTRSNYSWQDGYSETFHTQYPAVGFMTTKDYQIQQSSSNINYVNQTVTQIATSDVLINFNLGTRQDTQAPCIQSVDIVNVATGNKIKTFTFNYGYFSYSQIGGSMPSGQSGGNLIAERLMLTSVQETGYDPNTGQLSSSNPPYQFAYNQTNPLPLKTSYAKDFWGYYNGINNTNLLPDLTYPYDSGMIGGAFPYSYVNAYTGANRAVDTSKLSSGMLTQITYPTGGYTKFGYESNSFSNYDYPDVNKITNSFTSVTATDYNNPPYDHPVANFTLYRQVTIPITCTFSRGVPANSALQGSQMQSAYVNLNKIENGVTTTLEQWNMNNTSTWTAFNQNGYYSITTPYTFTYDPNATYQLVASLPDNLGDEAVNNEEANVSASFNCYNVPVAPSPVSYGGGVRVASIKNYDINGTLLSNKSVQYVNSNGATSGILMSPLLLSYPRNTYCIFATGTSSTQNLDYEQGNVWYMSSESAIPFSTAAGGNIVGYSRVVETELSNNAATNGTHVYCYNNKASETGIAVPDNPSLLNGKIDTERVYTNSGTLLRTTIYNYSSLSDSVTTGFKNFNDLMINNIECGGQVYNIPAGFPIYIISEYPIISHWYMPASKTVTQYDGITPLTTNEYYTYNPMGQLSVDSTINSKNQGLSVHFIYPYDKFPGTPTAVSLVDSAFYNNLLEQHTYTNGIETSEAKIGYAIINNQLVRNNLSKSFNGNALYTAWTFDAYGPNKTLQQASQNGLQPSAFIYDQNHTYLIAEVKNAVLNDVAYSSFEPNQPGNWTMSSTSGITANQGFSGTQSFNLNGGFTLSKSGLTSSQSYIVSYWTNGTSPLSITGTSPGYPIKGFTLNGWTYYEHLVTGQTTLTLGGTSNVDEVRLYPSTAQMTTYTYTPLVGMTSSTDAKDETTYYEYDAFQRLINIKDKDRNVTKHYTYHYQGQ